MKFLELAGNPTHFVGHFTRYLWPIHYEPLIFLGAVKQLQSSNHAYQVYF
jgi:hypothetical protein